MTGVTTTGGDPAVVLAALAGLALAFVLSLAVAHRLYVGYRRARDPAMGRLAVGLVLLTAGPILVRLLATNLSTVSPAVRSLAVTGCELCGLLVVLAVIYDA